MGSITVDFALRQLLDAITNIVKGEKFVEVEPTFDNVKNGFKIRVKS
jgi:hypothetical protein